MVIQDKVAGGEATETGEKEEESAFDKLSHFGESVAEKLADDVCVVIVAIFIVHLILGSRRKRN